LLNEVTEGWISTQKMLTGKSKNPGHRLLLCVNAHLIILLEISSKT
jgi:hypothetical protein